MSNTLFTPTQLGSLSLKNRIVMAPLTRSRAIGNLPNALMEQYYRLRAEAGLIITEGTSPSPNGLGYARIPGLFNDDQVQGWRRVTDGVHQAGGKIFVQLMHTGRVSHPANLPAGASVVAPSAVAAPGEMWTDADGHAAASRAPRNERSGHCPEHRRICGRGETGHAGRLRWRRTACGEWLSDRPIPQYGLQPAQRPLGRQCREPHSLRCRSGQGNASRPLVPSALACVSRHMAYSTARCRMPRWMRCTCVLIDELNALGLLYIHVVDHSAMGAPEVSPELKARIRATFKGKYILSGGYDLARANADLDAQRGDLVAFGRPFISNPDLVAKLKSGRSWWRPISPPSTRREKRATPIIDGSLSLARTQIGLDPVARGRSYHPPPTPCPRTS